MCIRDRYPADFSIYTYEDTLESAEADVQASEAIVREDLAPVSYTHLGVTGFPARKPFSFNAPYKTVRCARLFVSCVDGSGAPPGGIL